MQVIYPQPQAVGFFYAVRSATLAQLVTEQITVFFPSPFLSDEIQVLKTPDWSHLDLWGEGRRTYLGIEPDDRDRSGKRMIHG